MSEKKKDKKVEFEVDELTEELDEVAGGAIRGDVAPAPNCSTCTGCSGCSHSGCYGCSNCAM